MDRCGGGASGEEDAGERALPASQWCQLAWIPEPFCPHLAEVLGLREGHRGGVGVAETLGRRCKVDHGIFRHPVVPWRL